MTRTKERNKKSVLNNIPENRQTDLPRWQPDYFQLRILCPFRA